MELINRLLTLVVTTPDLGQILGWFFVLAIIIGGILDRDGRDLLQWLVATSIFAVFVAVAGVSIMSKFPGYRADLGVAFVILLLVLYGIGLGVGWTAVYLNKKRIHRKRTSGG